MEINKDILLQFENLPTETLLAKQTELKAKVANMMAMGDLEPVEQLEVVNYLLEVKGNGETK